jgi:hypothetical protein
MQYSFVLVKFWPLANSLNYGLILAYLISSSGGPNLLKVIFISTICLKKYAIMLLIFAKFIPRLSFRALKQSLYS